MGSQILQLGLAPFRTGSLLLVRILGGVGVAHATQNLYMNTTTQDGRDQLDMMIKESKQTVGQQDNGARDRLSRPDAAHLAEALPQIHGENRRIMAKPDQNAVLRQLPIAVGGLAGTMLMLNRLLTPTLTTSQARSDVVGVIVCAVLILTGLLWQRIQPRSPDTVDLIGEEGFELDDRLSDVAKTELAWLSHLLLTNTVTRSLVVYYDGRVLLRRGILGPTADVTPGAIATRVMNTQSPVYLVKLSLYPGRLEFNYLPENTQGVICQPIGDRGVMVLGANAPRSYTAQDETWIAGLADKLAITLQTQEIESAVTDGGRDR
jgi:hypothetical protein